MNKLLSRIRVTAKRFYKVKRLKELENFGLIAIGFMAAMLTACSGSDDSITEEPKQPTTEATDAPKIYTMTVTATKGDNDATRALSLDNENKTLNAAWETTDVVTVMKYATDYLTHQQYWKVVGYLKPTDIQNNGLTCTLTGKLTSETFNVDNYLMLAYPDEEIIEADTPDPEGSSTSSTTDDKSYSIFYFGQDGKLATIAKQYDYCTTPQQLSEAVKITAVEGTSITASHASFTNEQAIVRFILTDKSNNPINARELTISAQKNEEEKAISYKQIGGLNPEQGTGQIKVYPDGKSNEVFVALSGVSGCDVTLTANDYLHTYEPITRSNVTFTNGQYYSISVKMTKLEDPPTPPATLVLTSPALGQIIASDGKNYAANANLPSGVTKVAVIAYLGNESNCDHGLAIAMSDEEKDEIIDEKIVLKYSNWSTAVSTAAAHTPKFTNATWRLPSNTDLQRMFIACGSNGKFKAEGYMINKTVFDSSGFMNMLNIAGAPILSTRYWSSSHTSYSGWNYNFETQTFYSSLQTNGYRSRAVLAW
jgi:hypothetical protein